MMLAIYNLMQNAVKYSFDNHFVSIKGEPVTTFGQGRMYQLTISNFGVGILQYEIDRRLIFREDYRGVLSPDRNRIGTGLGLAVVDEIVTRHQGHIDVISISAIEYEQRRKRGGALDKGVIERLIKPGEDLEFGFHTTFVVTLPYDLEHH